MVSLRRLLLSPANPLSVCLLLLCICVSSLTHARTHARTHRDDLESTAFVLAELLLGRLPWADQAKAKDKAAVLALKEEVRSEV